MESSDFSTFFVSGNQVESRLVDKYKKIYQHWDSIWSAAFQEVNEGDRFFSDHFTRQDEIMALFYKDECISVCCHRLANMALPSFRKDSYFQAWPDDAIAKLRSQGDQVVIDNLISVDPRFRKLQNGIKFIELMSYMSFRHLSRLKASSITAASRNARSMNSIFEKFEPMVLASDVIFHGESTSLYALFPEQMSFRNIAPDLRGFGDDLLLNAQRSQTIHSFFSEKGESYVQKPALRVA
jgi:hypothetical protein